MLVLYLCTLTSQIQTWDGIIGGERLYTMSCSDKIARWNILGIQGSLLSLYVDPIYFKSIIVGAMYHEHHLTRALYTRISGILNLPESYIPNLPLLHGVSDPPARVANKSPTQSVNWSWGDRDVEVVNSRTGKLSDIVPSRLCKQLLFEAFLGLWDSLASRDLRQKVLEKKLLPAGVIAGLLSAALARSSSSSIEVGGGNLLPGLGLGSADEPNNGVRESSNTSRKLSIPSLFSEEDSKPSQQGAGEEGETTEPKGQSSPKQEGEGTEKEEEEEERGQSMTDKEDKPSLPTSFSSATNAMPFSEGFKSHEVTSPLKSFTPPSPSPHLLSSITALQVRKHCTYGEVKSLAVDYQVAKEKLSNHFKLNWGSHWIGKPDEQDKFIL